MAIVVEPHDWHYAMRLCAGTLGMHYAKGLRGGTTGMHYVKGLCGESIGCTTPKPFVVGPQREPYANGSHGESIGMHFANGLRGGTTRLAKSSTNHLQLLYGTWMGCWVRWDVYR